MIAPKLPKNEALGEKGREAISRAVVISIRPIALAVLFFQRPEAKCSARLGTDASPRMIEPQAKFVF
jgi:hypothetical protein